MVFAFHGYPNAVHQLLHGRANAARFHVRGYREEGTTTTPFDMVVLNQMSRYHLAMEAIRRARRPLANAAELTAACEADAHAPHRLRKEHLEDMPEVAGVDMGEHVTGSRAPILCINSGSSSLKLALFRPDASERLLTGGVEGIGLAEGRAWVRRGGGEASTEKRGAFPDTAAAIHAAFELLDADREPAPQAIGHRVVHGGPHLVRPRGDR